MNKKSASRQSQFRLKPAYAAVLLAFSVQTAQANPQGGSVASGNASFATSGRTLTVTNTPGTIINWQGFSIGSNEITQFAQQSASSTVLNRVVGADPSSILGTLRSNGRVFLVNPNGILFGAGSVVDVAGLTASTLNLSNADFLAGKNHFTKVPGAGDISNAGSISAHDNGQIYLIAPNVENTGIITAPNGEILLAAGHSVDLVSTNDPNLRVNITAPAGNVTNIGKLIASSGSLGLFGTVVSNSGVASADSATMQGGKIVFKASQRVEAGGTISAQGAGGGTINMLADMQGGTVNVSGTLDASAPVSGNGGHIDTSAAHVQVADSAHIATAAANGSSGNWLIDPTDFVIAAADPANGSSYMSNTVLSTSLASGNVTIQTLASGTGNGDIFVNDAVSWNATTNLTLNAIRNVTINAPITSGSFLSNPGSLTVRADLNGTGVGTILFGASGLVSLQGGSLAVIYGAANLFYNPTSYATPTDYTGVVNANLNAWMLVSDVNQLQAMSTNLTGTYALGRDIDASVTSTWNAGAGFIPVGDANFNFTGRFNGLGHTIDSLNINTGTGSNAGLFGVIGAAGVAGNVYLTNAVVSGWSNVGVLAGANAGFISNSYVSGSKVVAGATDTAANAGGLVGNNAGTIDNSYVSNGSVGSSAGTTSNWAYNFGGLAGLNGIGGGISNSYVSGGSVSSNGTGAYNIGGLAGLNDGGTISDSYANGGTVHGNSTVGGLVGYNNGSLTNSYVSNGNITGAVFVGGVVGYNNFYGGGVVANTFWDSSTAGAGLFGIAYDPSFFGSTNVNAADLAGVALSSASYAGFDFGATWWLSEGNTRPFLRSEWSTNITNAHQLQLVAMDVTAGYTLGADIDMAETASGAGMWGSKGFVQLGDSSVNFTGQFDGLGHTISNVYINRPAEIDVGLFGVVAGGSNISNVGLLNSSVTGSASYSGGVGGLAGYNNGTINNSYASGVSVLGSAPTYAYNVGGLAGYNAGTISNSYANGGVVLANSLYTNYYIGGLVGNNTNTGTIDSSSSNNATGGVSSYYYVGGLVGYNYGIVSNSSATGTVIGNYAVGGLAGYNGNIITDSNASGTVAGVNSVGGLAGVNGTAGTYTTGATWGGHITNSYVSSGNVSGTSNIGGLVGSNYGKIKNNHYDIDNVIINSGHYVTLGGIYAAQYADWQSGVLSLNINNYNVLNGGSFTGPLGGTSYTINGVQGIKDLLGFAGNAAYTFSLAANIDLGSNAGLFIPYLAANLDGAGFTISNLNLNQAFSGSNLGMFGVVASGSTVSNLILSNPFVTGSSKVGAIAGNNRGTISNSHVDTANVSGTSEVGGLAGSNQGTISGSYISGGTITGNGVSDLGGLAGYNDGTIDLSSAMNVTVAGTNSSNVGGLVGYNLGSVSWSSGIPTYYGGIISNSYVSNGAVSGGTNVGGLVGYSRQGNISNSYVSGGSVTGISGSYYGDRVGGLVGYNNSTIDSSSAYGGVVVQGNYDVGGLVGYNDGSEGGGAISNSHFDGGIVTGAGDVGGLVGKMYNGFSLTTYYGKVGDTISNSYASNGTVTATSSSDVGGLVGYSDGDVSDSHVSAIDVISAVTGSAADAGGLVGYNNGSISNSYVTGGSVLASSASDIGGLVGYNAGSIGNSFVSGGTVSGPSIVGGLVGYNLSAGTYSTGAKWGGHITNSYVNGGTVSGSSSVGGLVGINYGKISNTYASTGVVGSTNAGGLVGYNGYDAYGGNISANFWDTTAAGAGVSFGIGYDNNAPAYGGSDIGATPLDSTGMMTMTNFTGAGWDIANTGGAGSVWRVYEGYTAPLLTSFLTQLSIDANANQTYNGVAYSGDPGATYTPGIANPVLLGAWGGTSQGARNVGSYTIDASGLYSDQLGYDISYTNGNLTITPASLSINAVTDSRTYDGTTASAGMVTSTGLQTGDTITASQSFDSRNAGTRTLSVDTGYTVNDGNGGLNYFTPTLNTATGSIGQATLSLSAVSDSRTYNGLTTSAGVVTSTGLQTGDTITASQSFDSRNAGTRTLSVDTGYTINDGNGGLNYTVAPLISAAGTITPATLTVTADYISKIQNTSDPLLTYMVSGLQTGDTAAATLSGVLSRDPGETVGAYQINQGTLGLISSNYTMTYVGATFSILAPISDFSVFLTGLEPPEDEKDKPKLDNDLIVLDTTNSINPDLQSLPMCGP